MYVLACLPCNHRKSDPTPQQAGMRIRKRPVQPTWNPPGTNALRWSAAHEVLRIESWSKFVSEAYWDVELAK